MEIDSAKCMYVLVVYNNRSNNKCNNIIVMNTKLPAIHSVTVNLQEVN